MNELFRKFATRTSEKVGSPWMFMGAVVVIIAWAVTGPIFGFSDTWQLIINTGTTIVTFLMVFLIQNTQNRDGAAIQAKLDELIRVTEKAQNSLIGIEELTNEELDEIRARCAERAHAAEARARELAGAASDAADQGHDPIRAAMSARAGLAERGLRKVSGGRAGP